MKELLPRHGIYPRRLHGHRHEKELPAWFSEEFVAFSEVYVSAGQRGLQLAVNRMNFSALPGAHLPTSQPMSEKRHGATYERRERLAAQQIALKQRQIDDLLHHRLLRGIVRDEFLLAASGIADFLLNLRDFIAQFLFSLSSFFESISLRSFSISELSLSTLARRGPTSVSRASTASARTFFTTGCSVLTTSAYMSGICP